MNVIWSILVISPLVKIRAEFFHEPSGIQLSSPSVFETSDFGFSVAFQDQPSRLVVGAPQQDYVGKVFECPLTDLSRNIDCSIIDMSSLKIEEKTQKARMEADPNQRYFFGASLAATSDYFLTCAPLLPKILTAEIGRMTSTYAMSGECYIYNSTNKAFTEWKDSIYKLQNEIDTELKNDLKRKNKDVIDYVRIHKDNIVSGGMGWNTLLDEKNGFLLVAKPAAPVDILFVDTNNMSEQFDSLLEAYIQKQSRQHLTDTGYGMTVGYFFDKSVPMYAVSTQHPNWKGNIMFLEIDRHNSLHILGSDEEYIDTVSISNDDLGTMFGYDLDAADLNGDGLSELIVGAPTQPDEDYKRVIGAIHIYIGGDLAKRNDDSRKRSIFGAQDNSRFGSVIATSDIDRDGVSEIIVSAPYENNEDGTVYVISGLEVQRTLLSPDGRMSTRVTDLKWTQQIHGDKGTRHFGFSIQVVKDLNDNGCEELAIGSPASNKVKFLRCLPAVTAYTNLTLLGDEVVKEDADQFIVNVCLTVINNESCRTITGSIEVFSEVTGKAIIMQPTFFHDVSLLKEQINCKNVTVILKTSGSADYTFSTQIRVTDAGRNDKVYKSWAVLSAHSELFKSLPVKRYCTGSECEPKLSLNVTWTGPDAIDTSPTANKTYLFQIVVDNSGPDVRTASISVSLKGARISQQTEQCFGEDDVNYSCALPKTLKRDASVTIDVWINTTEAMNFKNLEFTASLNDKVFKNIKYEPTTLLVPFLLDTNTINVNGNDHSFQITDKDIQNKQIDAFSDDHEYYIVNSGTVTWQNITANLVIKKETFITNVQIVTTQSCIRQLSDIESKYSFVCTLTIQPGATKKIVVSFKISKENIASPISKMNLYTNSTLTLFLNPTVEKKHKELSTQLHYKKMLQVGNNLPLILIIVIVVALVLLILITFVLYKFGFFKRDEKQKLDVLRESVRRRSVRKASEDVKSPKPSSATDENHCEIEVVDDCVFQEVEIVYQVETSTTSKDNVELIKE